MRGIGIRLGGLVALLAAIVMVGFAPAADAATAPTVTTVAVSGVTPSTATLSGSVNLNGSSLATLDPSSTCYFEYGTSPGSGETSQAPCSPSPASTGTTTVSANLTGLSQGATYDFRLVVVTGGLAGIGSTSTSSSESSFTTPSNAALPVVATAAGSTVGGTSAFLNGTVNPQNWPVASCTFTYGPSGGATTTAACLSLPAGAASQAVSAPVVGLTQGTTYTYSLSIVYGTGTPASAGSTSSTSFTTTAATLGTPTVVATGAALTGTVNPEGQGVSSCTFYYGLSTSDLASVPCDQSPGSITGTSPVSVGATVTSLAQKTKYVDSVVLVTDQGTAVAVPGSFTTLAQPTGAIAKATKISASTATLQGTVNAGGAAVNACAFQWGVNPLSGDGSKVAITEQCTSTPSANGSQKVTLVLRGLAPGTRYYDRLVLSTAAGYVITNSSSFTTPAGAGRPTVKLTRSTINPTGAAATFRFSRTGSIKATKYQCALATVSHDKTGKLTYRSCTSAKRYSKLKDTTYVFAVRAGNSAGYGRAVTKRFSI